MEDDEHRHDESDETHFWIDCPGCGCGGRIGVPLNYVADVVVCPKCRQLVRVRPEDRVLWQPADAMELLRRQFPYYDWEASDHRNSHPHGSSADRDEANTADGQVMPENTPPSADDRAGRFDEYGDQRLAPRRRAVGRHRVAPSARRPSPMQHNVSVWLDKEPVQFALVIAAGILPLALAMFVPRAMDRARLGDRGPAELARAPSNRTSTTPAANKPIAARLKPMPRPAASAPVATDLKPAAPPPEAATPDVLYRRGKERRARGDYMAAICDFDEVLRAKPEFVWCYYERAGAYSRMGNQQAALADLDRALLALPREPKVWHARAVVHHRLLNLKAAVAEIGHAVELVEVDARGGKPAFARLLKNKAEMLTDELLEHATALVKSGQHAAAAEEFSDVIERRPNCASAWQRRGLAYDQGGQYAKALADLNIALALRRGPAQAFKLRSVLHERNEDHAAALADMLVAWRLDPTNREYADRISCLRRQRQAQEWMRQYVGR